MGPFFSGGVSMVMNFHNCWRLYESEVNSFTVVAEKNMKERIFKQRRKDY
jgi:hypothetical protein